MKRSMTCEEVEFDMPVVNPAEVRTLGEKKRILFNVSQMLSLGEMRSTNDQWHKIRRELGEREGTVVDVTESILNYDDQASLREARRGPVDVDATQVVAAMRGHAEWPDFIRVECWLRDAMVYETSAQHRAAALKLWSISVASLASPEILRAVVEGTTKWAGYDVDSAQCSGRGSDLVAQVAWKRAMLYQEWLWADVLLAVERASLEMLWDWRKVEMSCFTHPKVDCELNLDGSIQENVVRHQDDVPGGYSGNRSSLVDMTGNGGDEGVGCDESDEEESEDDERIEQLIDFGAQQS